MPTARFDLRVAVVDGKIYALGGYNAEWKALTVNEMYDPATNTWTTKAPMPTLRADFAIAVYENKIYCIGGNIGGAVYNNVVKDGQYLRVNEVYDPATNTWEEKSPLPTARAGMNSAVAEGLIYLIGGNPNASLNEAYDPETDTWSTKASLQYYEETNQSTSLFEVASGYSYVGYASMVTLDEKIFWIGEMHSSSNTRLFMLSYNPINDSWSSVTQRQGLGIPRNAFATTGMWAPKRIYIGGANDFVYDPATDNWSSGAEIPGYGDSGFAVIEDKIYCLGGRYLTAKAAAPSLAVPTEEVVTADNKEYIPFGYGTVPPSVSVLSPKNGLDVSANLMVDFSVNKPASQLTYSLDGQANVTVTGNFTLSGLTWGAHNLIVYATDSFGNVGASTVNFTVEAQRLSIAIIIVATVAVIVCAAAVLVYFKRRKQQSA